jgi:hypothetical protein
VARLPLSVRFRAILPAIGTVHLALVQGALVRPLDIFDLAMHAAPLLLVALKLWRQWRAPPDRGA